MFVSRYVTCFDDSVKIQTYHGKIEITDQLGIIFNLGMLRENLNVSDIVVILHCSDILFSNYHQSDGKTNLDAFQIISLQTTLELVQIR